MIVMEVPAVLKTADSSFGAGASDVVPITSKEVDVLLSYSSAAGPLTVKVTVYVPPSMSVEAVIRNSLTSVPTELAETFKADGVTLKEDEASTPVVVNVTVG